MQVSAEERDAVVARLRAAGCVFAEDEAALVIAESASTAELDVMIDRRCAGEPLEQIVGWVEFAGSRLRVAPGVFVPRRRTELLAEEALALLSPGAVVIDLCCGVGAIGATLAAAHPSIELWMTDIDPDAVTIARRNAPPGARVVEGDLFAALPPDLRGHVDVIAANAPYVPTDEIAGMPREAREHEHRVALDGGADGLTLHRRIAAGARDWLRPGGGVLIETSARQADATVAALAEAGLTTRIARDDERDATVAIGTVPGANASRASGSTPSRDTRG